MSENTARNHCANAGGNMHYDFMDEYLYQYDMTCTLPSGSQFTCTQFPDANGTYLQNNVDCS